MQGTLAQILEILPDLEIAAADHDIVWFESALVPPHGWKDPYGDEDQEPFDAGDNKQVTAEQMGKLSELGIHWALEADDGWACFT